jgi:hypothetical protein
VREILRIELEEERQAAVVARDLVGLAGLDAHPREGGWEVTIDCAQTNRLVVRVLDAVEHALAGQPSSSAVVWLGGREYRLDGN